MFIVLSNALIPICFHNLIIIIPNTLIAGWNNAILCTRGCYYGHQVGKANILSLWFPSFQIEWMTCFPLLSLIVVFMKSLVSLIFLSRRTLHPQAAS